MNLQQVTLATQCVALATFVAGAVTGRQWWPLAGIGMCGAGLWAAVVFAEPRWMAVSNVVGMFGFAAVWYGWAKLPRN